MGEVSAPLRSYDGNRLIWNQTEIPGPPFAVFEDELQTCYANHFAIHELYKRSLFDELINVQRHGLQSYLIEKIII